LTISLRFAKFTVTAFLKIEGGLMKVKLKNLATVQTGYSFRSRLDTSEDGELAVIQMKDLLADNTVSLDDLLKISMSEVKSHHFVRRGDLVFRSRGLITSSAILSGDPGQAVVAAPLLRIRVKDAGKVLPEYLNWFLSQRDAQIFFASQATGTAQKMVGKEAIEDLEIFLPPLSTQRAIIELAALSEREASLLRTIAEKKAQYVSNLLMQAAKGE